LRAHLASRAVSFFTVFHELLFSFWHRRRFFFAEPLLSRPSRGQLPQPVPVAVFRFLSNKAPNLFPHNFAARRGRKMVGVLPVRKRDRSPVCLFFRCRTALSVHAVPHSCTPVSYGSGCSHRTPSMLAAGLVGAQEFIIPAGSFVPPPFFLGRNGWSAVFPCPTARLPPCFSFPITELAFFATFIS